MADTVLIPAKIIEVDSSGFILAEFSAFGTESKYRIWFAPENVKIVHDYDLEDCHVVCKSTQNTESNRNDSAEGSTGMPQPGSARSNASAADTATGDAATSAGGGGPTPNEANLAIEWLTFEGRPSDFEQIARLAGFVEARVIKQISEWLNGAEPAGTVVGDYYREAARRIRNYEHARTR